MRKIKDPEHLEERIKFLEWRVQRHDSRITVTEKLDIMVKGLLARQDMIAAKINKRSKSARMHYQCPTCGSTIKCAK